MSFTKFIQSLLPSFERTRVQEDIAEQRQYIKQTLMPALENSKKTIGFHELKSDEALSLHAMVQHAIPSGRSKGLFGTLISFFKEIDTSLRVLEGELVDYFEADVTQETLTYRRAALLRYLEITRFATRYASLATRVVLTAETAQNLKKESKTAISQSMTSFERKAFEGNQRRFVDILKALDNSGRIIVDRIATIPDLRVTAEDDKTAQVTVGAAKLDPLRLGFVASNINPIYMVRMAFTNLMHSLYQWRVEEARVMELKILELKQSQAGEEDAKTQEAIDYYTGRLNKLQGDIRDYEDDLS